MLSCTTINQSTVERYKYEYIDSAAEPILKSFEYEARIRGHEVDRSHLSITFGLRKSSKEDYTVGYCAKDPMGGVIIKLYQPSFMAMSDEEREELLFHELGHCLIGREHCFREGKTGPLSIMYPSVLDKQFYVDHREELVDELFNISPKCLGNNGLPNEVDGPICPPSNLERGQ